MFFAYAGSPSSQTIILTVVYFFSGTNKTFSTMWFGWRTRTTAICETYPNAVSSLRLRAKNLTEADPLAGQDGVYTKHLFLAKIGT